MSCSYGFTLTIRSNVNVMFLYIFFSSNGIICCAIAWTFSGTPKLLGDITSYLLNNKFKRQ